MPDITIPPEALEAAAIVLMSRLMVSQQDALHVWSGMYEPEKEQFRREARAACIAMLRAWPGMREWQHCARCNEGPHMLLPLPQEAGEKKFQPYTCSRCLGATENADDLCDDCATEASDD